MSGKTEEKDIRHPIAVAKLEPGQHVFLQTGFGDVEGYVTEVGADEVFVKSDVGLFDLQRWDIRNAYLYEDKRTSTFEMLAGIFDRAGINYDETAIKKIEPYMFEFLMHFTTITIRSIPPHLTMGLLDGMVINPHDVQNLIQNAKS